MGFAIFDLYLRKHWLPRHIEWALKVWAAPPAPPDSLELEMMTFL